MKLAICIPTHDGRMSQLRELLDSIVRQQFERSRVEICISDNASNDGSAEMVAEYVKRTEVPIRYFRFSTDMGVRNFINAIGLAQAEYCWLVGSDDAMMPSSLQTVLTALDQYPDIGGCTVNKLNFDVTLSKPAGADHEIVLPEHSLQAQAFGKRGDAISQLGMTFLFMSAHCFRRDLWNEELLRNGIDKISSINYFAHSYLVSRVAAGQAGWLWLPECLIVQRLGNSSAREELHHRELAYARQSTDDAMAFFLEVTSGERAPSYRELLRKLYVIYWNPIQVLRYKSEQACSFADDIEMLGYCTRTFRQVRLFWLTALPFLLIPSCLVRSFKAPPSERPKKSDKVRPEWLDEVITRMLIVLGVERGAKRDIERLVQHASTVASRFFAENRRSADEEAHLSWRQ